VAFSQKFFAKYGRRRRRRRRRTLFVLCLLDVLFQFFAFGSLTA
jgi:hypothetical protein